MYKLLIFVVVLICGAKADGMIEVFKWKQMDFYNRGGGANTMTSTRPMGQRPTYGDVSAGEIVFPDQYRSNKYVRVKKREVITSRDQPIRTDARSAFDDASDTNSINNGTASYIPYNNVPMGVNHHMGRLFVTMPRRRIGIPSTLNYIDLNADGNKESPKLHAYPNFEMNQFQSIISNPSSTRQSPKLVSVYRTSVDCCQRLWFIDTGMLEYPDNRQQIQRPAIWVVDLRTDRLVKRFEISQSIVETGRGLASITIDVKPNQCKEAFAYIPDLVYRQLYVYSLERDRIWAFSHNYFNFDPVAGDLNVGGQNFRWDDGIFSTTLGPVKPNGFNNLYFHPMASNNEFIVSTEVLQNEANAARSDHGQDFRVLGSRGSKKQSTMHSYDPKTGVIFYDEIQRNGVGCWNTNREFSPANHGTVAEDPQRMIYPSDLTIDDEGTIWVMTNSMPIFIYSNLDPNTFNFRIWKQNVYEAKKNTVCE